MRGYNVDSAICNHMIRLQSKSVQLAPELCLLQNSKDDSLQDCVSGLYAGRSKCTSPLHSSGEVLWRRSAMHRRQNYSWIPPAGCPAHSSGSLLQVYFIHTVPGTCIIRTLPSGTLFKAGHPSVPCLCMLIHLFVWAMVGWVTLYLSTNLVCYIYAYVFLCIKLHSFQHMHYGDEYVKQSST